MNDKTVYATATALTQLEDAIARSLKGAKENFDLLRDDLSDLEHKADNMDTGITSTLDVIESEVNRVFENIANDINAIREDSSILHQVINDIDNEKGELEDRMVKMEKVIAYLQRRTEELIEINQNESA